MTLPEIDKVLADPGKYYPGYDPKVGYEVAGLVWFQLAWSTASPAIIDRIAHRLTRTRAINRTCAKRTLAFLPHGNAAETYRIRLFASPNTPVVLEQPGTAIRRCRRRAVYAVFGRSRRNACLIQHRAIACCGVRSILGLLVDMLATLAALPACAYSAVAGEFKFFLPPPPSGGSGARK